MYSITKHDDFKSEYSLMQIKGVVHRGPVSKNLKDHKALVVTFVVKVLGEYSEDTDSFIECIAVGPFGYDIYNNVREGDNIRVRGNVHSPKKKGKFSEYYQTKLRVNNVIYVGEEFAEDRQKELSRYAAVKQGIAAVNENIANGVEIESNQSDLLKDLGEFL